MRPVCVTCGLEMRCERNDHGVEKIASAYRSIAFGDRYGCDGCGFRVVVGFGEATPRHFDETRYESLTELIRDGPDYTAIRID